MHYDQSWMGFGIVGGMEAGAISTIVALVLFAFFHWLGQRNAWGYGTQISWTALLTALLTVSGDLWDLFYFNYGKLQSIDLLRAKLAEVHDPDSIGVRVMCELLGIVIGVYVSWLICHSPPGARLLRRRE
jgi:hypothetical protein